ncbi:uncharacterized protein [Primulina huaijiensis]|uniref:uncharacterized protein n=1 Tax=Primulina huaijiensis TaxID=1492673 RepID=UPI003CC75807
MRCNLPCCDVCFFALYAGFYSEPYFISSFQLLIVHFHSFPKIQLNVQFKLLLIASWIVRSSLKVSILLIRLTFSDQIIFMVDAAFMLLHCIMLRNIYESLVSSTLQNRMTLLCGNMAIKLHMPFLLVLVLFCMSIQDFCHRSMMLSLWRNWPSSDYGRKLVTYSGRK